ncbi:MAG: DUF4238 domain-containing protein [bacterium]
MAQKRRQHIIPISYQKAFVDPKRPKGIPDNIPFEPAIWMVEKSLESEPKLRSPSNVLCKSYFYKLEDDDKRFPVIEEALSRIESNYPFILGKIRGKERLSLKEMLDLAVFIDTLLRRTESHIDFRQDQIDTLEELYRKVDRCYNKNEQISNDFWKGSHEFAKKLIISAIGAVAILILKFGIIFVFNKSDLPFFTSDNPVMYEFMHIDDLYRYNVPKAWTYNNVGTNEKQFFCYCALSPDIALISSPFLMKHIENPYIEVLEMHFPFGMNILTHLRTNSILISCQSKPYGNYQEKAIKIIKFAQNIKLAKGKILLFYTEKARYYLKVNSYDRINKNPIRPEVHFYTEDLKTLHDIARDDNIEVVYFYEDGIEMGGTRNLKFHSVSLQSNCPSVIKANW